MILESIWSICASSLLSEIIPAATYNSFTSLVFHQNQTQLHNA